MEIVQIQMLACVLRLGAVDQNMQVKEVFEEKQSAASRLPAPTRAQGDAASTHKLKHTDRSAESRLFVLNVFFRDVVILALHPTIITWWQYHLIGVEVVVREPVGLIKE